MGLNKFNQVKHKVELLPKTSLRSVVTDTSCMAESSATKLKTMSQLWHLYILTSNPSMQTEAGYCLHRPTSSEIV